MEVGAELRDCLLSYTNFTGCEIFAMQIVFVDSGCKNLNAKIISNKKLSNDL